MPDTPPPPPTPATPTELAALYLRARDVPCLKCGYNRRDGTAAACPECGHHLRLGTIRDRLDIRTTRATCVVSVTIAFCAVIVCGGMIVALESHRYRPDRMEAVACILLAATVLSSILGVVFATRSMAHGEQKLLHQFMVTIGITTMMFTIGMVLVLWNDIF